MKTVIIHSTDFDINDQYSSDLLNCKLREIKEPFEVTFDFLITETPRILFYKTNLVKITIPDSVTKISYSSFEGCLSLSKINLPDTITEIAADAFYGCSSLTQITLPQSLTRIDRAAFCGCTSLKEITLPSSIKFLGTYIFGDEHPSLQKITIQLSKEDFLKNVEGAQYFYVKYKDLIIFEDLKSIDMLLFKTNSIETIINTLEPEH